MQTSHEEIDMELSAEWRRQHMTNDATIDAREALRRANARRDERWRKAGRVTMETAGATAALVIVLTAIGVLMKLIVLLWQWILT
jgi:hypothetical protein